ncbi:hypothetical protein L6452_16046 [Arctium lappa]|uniref:Uncharacterized protein n=1 Tax=Arctium lappa TaxID=4217 RepID=A0ACB9BZN1_ARCLA|nr:hypothetical protein L6452_16046 [Arctium lappa]
MGRNNPDTAANEWTEEICSDCKGAVRLAVVSSAWLEVERVKKSCLCYVVVGRLGSCPFEWFGAFSLVEVSRSGWARVMRDRSRHRSIVIKLRFDQVLREKSEVEVLNRKAPFIDDWRTSSSFRLGSLTKVFSQELSVADLQAIRDKR